MEFVCYYQEHELPINEGNYRVIADRVIYGYQYNLDEDYYYAVWVENNLYSVYTCAEDEVNENNLVRKAHEVMRFYRETKGVQSSHISADTIRQIETLCNINRANVNYNNNAKTIATANIRLEKKHFVRDNNDYWSITYNGRLLLLLSSENSINRIFDIINGDLFDYIIHRWGRFFNRQI
jgi:hypothetical protein